MKLNFEIAARGGTVKREIFGGLTTFMAMSYIIFAQVGILSKTGMDANGIIIATCLSAAVGSILMGLLANYPIGLAPGMGENVFFAFTAAPALAAMGEGFVGWEMALALVFCSGLAFLLLACVGFRSYILNSIPASLKSGIAAGIGLLVATVGLNFANITQPGAGGALVMFPGFTDNPSAALALLGLAVIMILTAWRVPGAVLIGIAVNTVIAMATGLVPLPESIISMPSGFAETAGGCFRGFGQVGQVLLSHNALELILLTLVLLLMDMFDTVGTLVGVASQTGLMKDGKLPKAERALSADAVGTMTGAMLGSSTVTSYIESITGVTVGARTGLAAVVTGLCFIGALFFIPIVKIIGGGVMAGMLPDGTLIFANPMIAPALLFVGAMMLKALRDVNWDDATEFLPAFLGMIIMPLTLSISHGIAAGFVFYALGKLLTGKAKQCPIAVYVVAGLFIIRYLLQLAIDCEWI